jgi:oligopeptide transport system permease protein
VYGARISIAVAIVGPLISIVIGLIVGLIAGYAGGRTDNLLMRFVDIMYAFPTILLIILLMAFFRAGQPKPGTFVFALGKLDAAMGGLLFIFIGIGITAWMGSARLVRAQVLSVRENEYIIAAHALGLPASRIISRHILPNIIGPLIITQTLSIPSYISYEAFLSFIGLGVNPPTPSWGSMIADGALVIQAYPNQALLPAFALFLLMFAFNFLGDGLRDALDPTLAGRA